MGLHVDKTNFGLLEFAGQDNQLSDEERCYKFRQSIRKSLNTEDFDTEEFYEQVRCFHKQSKRGMQNQKHEKPNPRRKKETTPFIQLPDADMSALERQIDQMVYNLYDITPEEIAIVEGKG